jgi:hypothetical protein
LTSLDACLAYCKAESACGSVIVHSMACSLARIPVTSANVIARPGSGVKFYNRDCVANPLAATTLPSTLSTSTVSTSTSTTSTSTPTVCAPAAPTVSCVAYPECQKFTAGLANSCPSHGGQCQDNYFVRCEQSPAPGSQTILDIPNISVDECRQRCDGIDNCAAFSYKASTCYLWKSLNGFNSDSATVYIRICPATTCSSAPVRRGEQRIDTLQRWRKPT